MSRKTRQAILKLRLLESKFENLRKNYSEGQNGHERRRLEETLQHLRKLLVINFLYEKQNL